VTTRSLALLLLAVVGLAACESSGTDPDPGPGPGGPPGTMTLVTATSGTQPDSDGYTIMLDGTAHGSIGPTDSVTVEGLEPGSHAVELADIEFNCATLGQFTRTVTIGSDAGAVVDYGVACDTESRSRISFVRYPAYSNAEVMLMNADGSDLTSLSDSLGAIKPQMHLPSVRWSPDGKRVAFTRWDGGLYATTGEGNHVVQLSPNGLSPQWSGDGRQVVFLAADQSGQPCCWDLFIAESDGSGVRQLTDGLTVNAYDFAANGSLIVFPTDITNPGPLAFIRPDGTGYREIAPPGLCCYTRPTLSPDGSKVAYFAYPDVQGADGPGYEIYVSSTDGSGTAIDVSNNPGDDTWPFWSPDGTRIAFVSALPGGVGLSSLHVVNPDGTGQIQLTPADMSVGMSAWSPDGTRIAYVGNTDDEHVFVANAYGGGRTNLTPDFPANMPIWTGR
jgi:Tol biopolymer transport system component